MSNFNPVKRAFGKIGTPKPGTRAHCIQLIRDFPQDPAFDEDFFRNLAVAINVKMAGEELNREKWNEAYAKVGTMVPFTEQEFERQTNHIAYDGLMAVHKATGKQMSNAKMHALYASVREEFYPKVGTPVEFTEDDARAEFVDYAACNDPFEAERQMYDWDEMLKDKYGKS
jgi:hypothetical protein